jgi:hypothetical protein
METGPDVDGLVDGVKLQMLGIDVQGVGGKAFRTGARQRWLALGMSTRGSILHSPTRPGC